MTKNETALLHPKDKHRPSNGLGSARQIVRLILADYQGPVAVRLWNGERVFGDDRARCTLVFRHPAPFRHLILHQDIVRLGEAYLAGDLDWEGDMEALFDLVEYLRTYRPGWSDKLRVLGLAVRLPQHGHEDGLDGLRASRAMHNNSQASIARHYDVSNDFYRLWLDARMVYSCAYFRDRDQALDQAQADKLDYICRKLRLAPGQRFLDIGCGWGALVTWAARHYGVQAHGITLSKEQYEYAREKVREMDLEKQVTIELRDYRELAGEALYDRIASVGMFEHVGIDRFPVYFGTVRRVLKPGGLFLNHGITNDTGWRETPISAFVNRYVFPDGELTNISAVCEAMEQAGFEIIDVEGLRRHYALTLRRWIERLRARKEQAVALVGEPVYRLWYLYMSGSAYYFEQGSLGIYQVLAGHRYCAPPLPLRRDFLYTTTAKGTAKGTE